MEDNIIIEKLFRRSEDAIADVSEKYEANCIKIAERIVNNKEDAEECVNDTFLAVWNNIPPEKPNPLSAYIYRITRNIAITIPEIAEDVGKSRIYVTVHLHRIRERLKKYLYGKGLIL